MKRFLFSVALLAATLVCAEPADDWRALVDVAKAFETLTRNAKASGQATDLDLVEATLERLHAEIGLARATDAGDSALERLQAAARDRAHAARMAAASGLIRRGAGGRPALARVFLPGDVAKQFAAVTQITALAITKLDGTAKGGVVIGISDQFKIPVKYIGVGEKIEDLQVFDREEFVDSLFN